MIAWGFLVYNTHMLAVLFPGNWGIHFEQYFAAFEHCVEQQPLLLKNVWSSDNHTWSHAVPLGPNLNQELPHGPILSFNPMKNLDMYLALPLFLLYACSLAVLIIWLYFEPLCMGVPRSVTDEYYTPKKTFCYRDYIIWRISWSVKLFKSYGRLKLLHKL